MSADQRDWQSEIDAWTERFRAIPDPPEPFATALREGWTDDARTRLAAEAQEYATRQEGLRRELLAAGVDMVRLDQKSGNCTVCRPYNGSGYSLSGEPPELPPPPPLPICPACRHTLNMLTPFFLQSLGRSVEDVIDAAVPFTPTD